MPEKSGFSSDGIAHDAAVDHDAASSDQGRDPFQLGPEDPALLVPVDADLVPARDKAISEREAAEQWGLGLIRGAEIQAELEHDFVDNAKALEQLDPGERVQKLVGANGAIVQLGLFIGRQPERRPRVVFRLDEPRAYYTQCSGNQPDADDQPLVAAQRGNRPLEWVFRRRRGEVFVASVRAVSRELRGCRLGVCWNETLGHG
jgi:hypothetical protein